MKIVKLPYAGTTKYHIDMDFIKALLRVKLKIPPNRPLRVSIDRWNDRLVVIEDGK